MGLPGPQACPDMNHEGNEILVVSLVTAGKSTATLRTSILKTKHKTKKTPTELGHTHFFSSLVVLSTRQTAF